MLELGNILGAKPITVLHNDHYSELVLTYLRP